jgi:two-component system, OmpR family, response regulator
MRILIVEDDAMIGAGLVRGLTDEGHVVDWVRDGDRAADALIDHHHEFHLVLLDLGLPHRAGTDVLRHIRAAGDNVLVLIITARDGLADRIEGLDMGADDFLVKPFELAELKARIRALSRRHAGRIEPQLKTALLSLDPAARCVIRAGRSVQLTAREFALLQALMQRPGALLSRSQLESRIYTWSEAVDSNAVEFLLHGLRQKIGPDQIENVRGVGWRIVAGP